MSGGESQGAIVQGVVVHGVLFGGSCPRKESGFNCSEGNFMGRGELSGGVGGGGGSYLAGDFIESFQLMVSVLNVFKRKLLNLVFSKALPRNQGYFCFIQITSQMVLWTALFINLLMILIY